jgi:hypothetical protein
MRDGSNQDRADDDKDQFHSPIVAELSVPRRLCGAASPGSGSVADAPGIDPIRWAPNERIDGITRQTGRYDWQDGHQNRLRPSSSAVRTVVPHTRHGSPALR